MKRNSLLVLLGLLVLGLPGVALAQTYPSKPIRFIMPYPPGGSSDILARPIANEMSKNLGQSVIIEYKPGGGSTIGADFIAKSAPDGYTIVMLLTAHAINSSLMPKLPYDTVKDFTSITLAATLPLVVVVNAQAPIQSVQELIAAAGTPASIVQKLNAEFIKAMAAPAAKERIEAAGYQIAGSTPAQLDAHVRNEMARWAKVVKDSGAKIE